MTNNELIYSDFKNQNLQITKKTPYTLQPFFGSMVALTPLPNDNDVSPPAIIPNRSNLLQKSTLSKITKEDVNTVETHKLPFLTNVYFGSLSVVGLFILFRFIQKNP
jgi:hypothetical protein